LSAGALPQTPLGELTALPRPPSWILRDLLLRGRAEGKGREGKGEGRGEDGKGGGKRRGGEGTGAAPKLKLGPPELLSWRQRWTTEINFGTLVVESAT